MQLMSKEVWIINGIPGSGKSTTAKALAANFKRGVHIEGDALHDLIISGKVLPGQEPKDEEARQIDLCVKIQCLLATSYCEAGFTPVIDYVVVNKNRLEQYKKHLEGFSLHLVNLNPGANTALRRDRLRPEKTVAHFWTHLEQIIKNELNDSGYWVDNSQLSIDEVISQVLKNQHRAVVQN